ncbi:MAG: hypothetical protein A2748_00180 [Candidatus Wildermuthbacteria bacterium RIFCSPHIGHO2_01_FULL_45_20]|nr:MAG: hypothetical protein A2748_00180 [Candidatus Wildermuthbacteria bacterium RIFCSPHIGHO2_01_FULL_45_20]
MCAAILVLSIPVFAFAFSPVVSPLTSFVKSLIYFSSSSSIFVLLIHILWGIALKRSFIGLWYFLIILIPFFILYDYHAALLGGAFKIPEFLFMSFYASLFTIVAFLASAIGRHFKKIARFQDALQSLKFVHRFVLILFLYAVPLFALNASRHFLYVNFGYEEGSFFGIFWHILWTILEVIFLYKMIRLSPVVLTKTNETRKVYFLMGAHILVMLVSAFLIFFLVPS